MHSGFSVHLLYSLTYFWYVPQILQGGKQFNVVCFTNGKCKTPPFRLYLLYIKWPMLAMGWKNEFQNYAY